MGGEGGGHGGIGGAGDDGGGKCGNGGDGTEHRPVVLSSVPPGIGFAHVVHEHTHDGDAQ